MPVKHKYGKCDQPGCTTEEGYVIAKTIPSSGKWCYICNDRRLLALQKSQSACQPANHPFNKKGQKMKYDRSIQAHGLLKDLIKKLDSLFSIFVRKNSADENGMVKCITCPTIMHWKQMHLGHFVTRGTYAIRFEIMNCHCQCPVCNGNQQTNGEFEKHGIEIDRLYGDGTAEYLRSIKNKTIKIDRNWVMEQIKKYTL